MCHQLISFVAAIRDVSVEFVLNAPDYRNQE